MHRTFGQVAVQRIVPELLGRFRFYGHAGVLHFTNCRLQIENYKIENYHDSFTSSTLTYFIPASEGTDSHNSTSSILISFKLTVGNKSCSVLNVLLKRASVICGKGSSK